MSTVAVIVNPERFASQFQRGDLVMGARRSTRRNNPRRTGRICDDCLYGKHRHCADSGCTCIHRTMDWLELAQLLCQVTK
jgi:hypothetical protein